MTKARHKPQDSRSRSHPSMDIGKIARTLMLASLVALPGCAGPLVRLANDQDWTELDRRARAMNPAPRGKAARAWAEALVELDHVEEARAVLLRDFRHGGSEDSLLALAELERQQGLRGIAAAHFTRLIDLDLDTAQRSAHADAICDLLRERARAEAAIGEALAADADMRRVALVCLDSIDDDDRGFMTSIQPAAQAQAEGQHSLPSTLTPTPEQLAEREASLREQLEVARKRSPRALIGVAEAEQIQLEPDDVARLLAAEFSGALGPGFVSSRRLSAWIGDNPTTELLAAIDGLPDGVREYALLRISKVRPNARATSEEQAWMVAAMSSVAGRGPHEAAKAWRVSASVGDLGGAEFALNTNLRDMIPVAIAQPGAATSSPSPTPSPSPTATHHWSQRVPVDRLSFDLLLTLARLFELREQPVLALELRRSVIVAGYEVGLAQVGPAAAEEVLRQLALGRPWQALAVAEIVPGSLVDEVLPALASALTLLRVAELDAAIEADRNVVWRTLGDAWFEAWDPRLEAAMSGLDLRTGREPRSCPELGRWLEPEQDASLASVGLDPDASRAALEAAFTDLAAPTTGAALLRAVEADVGLACSAPLITLLYEGPHRLALESLDERLIHAPELSASAQLQLEAEIAAAHGASARASLFTLSAAAESPDPRQVWARAATAGSSFGLREYTLEALRQVVLHSEGLDDPAARREMLLIRLRDVDGDPILRGDGAPKSTAVTAVRADIQRYLDEAPSMARWARIDGLLWALASEPRADDLAAARLLEILEPLLEGSVADQHGDAIAALLSRLGGPTTATPPADSGPLGLPVLAYLSDADAICELIGGEALEPERLAQRLVGAATACGPRVRAEALAALIEVASTEARPGLRRRVLEGTLAAEREPDRPGVLGLVPALDQPQLSLRVAFDLALDPVWVTAPSTTPLADGSVDR